MVDLSTTYLGLKLQSPLVASASPISEKISNIRALEDAGAGAVVLWSLFEEQITQTQQYFHHYLRYGSESNPEATSYIPEPETFRVGPEGYLDHIQKAKAAVNIPIIASLNATHPGSWAEFAKMIEQAGADALELNMYYIPTDLDTPGSEIEQRYLDVLDSVREQVTIPLAVKLSPFFSNMANMAQRLVASGAKGLVLFNRFYQPDIDLENLEVYPHILLSTPQAQRLPMRWIAILYGRLQVDFAATSGIHTAEDAIKMIMAGASATMMASALLTNGVSHLGKVKADLAAWLTEREYVSVAQMRGSLSQIHTSDPATFERAQYIRALAGYQSRW